MTTKKSSGIPEVDLASYIIEPQITNIIPASLAEKYEVIPLFKVGNNLTVAMADPTNIVALDQVRLASKMDISVVKSTTLAIKQAIAEYYGVSGIVEDIIKKYPHSEDKAKDKTPITEESPVIKLVNAIFQQAIKERASDVHIEPEAKHLRVRFRVDGVLHEELTIPSYMLAPIVSRIKVLADMDIAESRVPQDGRFEMRPDGKAIDFRVSTYPSVYGEKVVLRILDKSSMVVSLTEIGMEEENFHKFKRIIHKPHGIILVTGPTGSGKTSTLYAVLSELNSRELNIMTVEDPIEYEIEGITQSQVNIKAGLTFATALRSILRQDPDVILIGEIRDLETANIAIQSALTGHLVFSTLHTNDAAQAITRLIDMGVEPFLISSSVEAVLAQRLVRNICAKCKEEIPMPASIREKYPAVEKMYKGKGCKACKVTGYKGRSGIFELLLVDENIRKMVADKISAEEIRKYAISQGMKTLNTDGLSKVQEGITTLDEVMRVTELE